MSITIAQARPSLAPSEVRVQPELDLDIRALSDVAVRMPYGSIKMDLGATRAIDGTETFADAAVRMPYGALRMNLSVSRDILVIGKGYKA
jgi:hypothetical protein